MWNNAPLHSKTNASLKKKKSPNGPNCVALWLMCHSFLVVASRKFNKQVPRPTSDKLNDNIPPDL